MKKICECCKKELEENKKNFVLINYGNEYKHTNICRVCMKTNQYNKLYIRQERK